MPELPDVEGFRRDLARHAAGQRVEHVSVQDPAVLRNTTPQALGRALRGSRLGDPRRHGKWLLLPTGEGGDGGPTLLVHPGMTGNVAWFPRGAERHPHDRVVLALSEGEVRYRDMRKLRGVWLARPGEPLEALTGPLGPDAYGVRRRTFASALHGQRRALKTALMDQSVIAGLGNLLADEICWRARLYPGHRIDRLTSEDLAGLHRETGRVLRASIPTGRVPGRLRWLTGQRDRPDGGRCPRCRSSLRRARIGGRGTVWCPRCQRG